MKRKMKFAGALKQCEAAEYIGMSEPKFIELKKQGYFKPCKYPNGILVYSVKKLDKFIEEHQL